MPSPPPLSLGCRCDTDRGGLVLKLCYLLLEAGLQLGHALEILVAESLERLGARLVLAQRLDDNSGLPELHGEAAAAGGQRGH